MEWFSNNDLHTPKRNLHTSLQAFSRVEQSFRVDLSKYSFVWDILFLVRLVFTNLVRKNLSLYFAKVLENLWRLQFTNLLPLSSKTNLAKSFNAKQSQIMSSMFIQTNWLLVNIAFWKETRQEKGCDEYKEGSEKLKFILRR